MTDEPLALRARFVFPVCSPPIADGVVTIRAGQIVRVGSATDDVRVRDLGHAAILPGLVNAHTHLEFSDLATPLGTAGTNLPDWITDVIGHRRTAGAEAVAAVVRGLEESLVAGTTTLGEIATTDWRTAGGLPEPRPTTVMFHEAIGPTLSRAQMAVAAAEAFLSAAPGNETTRPALSPHAPYTVHSRLLTALVEMSREHKVPLAMHLAESREELELLTLESGPFRDLLEDVGAWDASDGARLSCILDYLTELARAHRALVIHGNYLDDEEIEFLAGHAARMSVVYCPRTHAYFGQEPYPLARMLAAGVAMALGTDSRASNPDLSVLEEMKAAAAAHADVSREALVRMATRGGAAALGLGDAVGTLEAGKRADLAVVGLGGSGADDPHEVLFAPESRVVETWLGGLRVGGPLNRQRADDPTV